MFYPRIAETKTDVVNKDLEDQYKHSYKHKMFYPLIAETETEVVNKDIEDQYKHRATNTKCFILSLQRQGLGW